MNKSTMNIPSKCRIASIEADVVQDTYDFTGGGRFGPKTNVHTKEDADHSLPYLLAVALIDGDVQPAQLNPERIAKTDVQSLLLKVTVRPDKSFRPLSSPVPESGDGAAQERSVVQP